MEYSTVETALNAAGYKNIKKISNTKLAVLVDENRIKTLENIQKVLKGSKYDTKPGGDSSAGRVIFSGITILAKPASKQGKASAGVDNEETLVNYIEKACENGPMNVIFVDDHKNTFEVFGCVGAKSVGADTANRKKADVVLTDYKGQVYPISIKKDDAETWESADTYFKNGEINKIIEKAIKAKKTSVVLQKEGYFKIEPNIAFAATTAETRDVVFGSDIEGKGCILTKTFRSDSIETKEDVIFVDCTNLITKLSDVKGPKEVMFLIRNDSTRKAVKGYPGIRVLAAYAKRINKNVTVVQR